MFVVGKVCCGPGDALHNQKDTVNYTPRLERAPAGARFMQARRPFQPSLSCRTMPGSTPLPSPPAPSSPRLDPSKTTVAEALLELQDQYVQDQQVKIKIGSWNVAAVNGAEKELKNWFVREDELTKYLESLKLSNESEPKESSTTGSNTESKPGQPSEPKTAPGSEEIGVYVLGLQEVVDISSPALLLNPYVDPLPAQRWRSSLEEALPLGYQPVAEIQLVGMLIFIYASPKIASIISNVSTTSVPTGGMGWTGNKGAVLTRIVLGGATRLLIVNAHLTAGNEKGNLERRNWDFSQICTRTKFTAVDDGVHNIEGATEVIGDEDIAFWFGDLNYRLDGIPGADVRRLLMIHTGEQYKDLPKDEEALAYGDSFLDDSSNSNTSEPPESAITLVDTEASAPKDSEEKPDTKEHAEKLDPKKDQASAGQTSDPAAVQATISSLLPHDQLHAQIKQGKAFHDGWQEDPVTFLPTYKYDIGTIGAFDSSEKMRSPSWCDRILYRTKETKEAAERLLEEAKARSSESDDLPSDVLFDYDPNLDGDEADSIAEDAKATEIKVYNYVSHQNITSSDHKPLEATFTVTFKAEDPAKKDLMYWELARQLDNAENDNQPRVTIVSNPIGLTGNRTLDFGVVGPEHPPVRTDITVANTGTAPAVVHLLYGGEKEAPDWLKTVFNDEGRKLEVGDVATIALAIGVPFKNYKPDMEGAINEELEHILVIRVDEGADYFVELKGTWNISLEEAIKGQRIGDE